MSTVRLYTQITPSLIGSPTLTTDATETLTVGAEWKNTVSLTAAATASLSAVWDATADGNPSTFQKLVIAVDPNYEAASVLDVIVEVRVTTTLLFFTVNRTAPLIFAKQAADVSLPASGANASTINRIRAANHNTVSAANDVKIQATIYR